ncbi:hypothetical protein BDV33DRAFT_84993 [Aspergillus novoparasiticus]|uniref:Uncharacterized protein n=1 Tax=Aspergillus novoparasiticus TaxID=986946 RepID=A0A5N6EUH1_9EURO|nr:hypothetical protein BDV33DRAFT_84993 [Aspergillus novoparasiticus]
MSRGRVFPSNESKQLLAILTHSASNVSTKAPGSPGEPLLQKVESPTYFSPLERTSISGSEPLFHRTTSTMSSNPRLSTQHTGLSSRTYIIEHVLQEEGSPSRQVYVIFEHFRSSFNSGLEGLAPCSD